jgi:hypothetical protein
MIFNIAAKKSNYYGCGFPRLIGKQLGLSQINRLCKYFIARKLILSVNLAVKIAFFVAAGN